MTQRTAVRRKGLAVAEIYALPAMFPALVAGTACHLSRTTTYELINKEEFPIPVVRIGRSLLCRRSDLLTFLGMSEDDNGAAVAPATPSVELTNESAA